ncbi:MAG: lysoplasmalogenase [Spirochaetes bacterium]|nr:lysoplasmalogenase [Spirochaetota bacterium]
MTIQMLPYALVFLLMAVMLVLLHRAEFAGNQRGIYMTKPLCSTLMVAVLLLSLCPSACGRWQYTLALLAGMLLSFGGDMALMFMNASKKAFRIGLVLFLLGHVAYIVVFTAFSGFHRSDWVSALVLAVLAVGIYLYLRPGLGDMKVPVLAYVVIISLMVNRAISTFYGTYFNFTQAALITSGAIMFFVSDVILAMHRFRHNWRYGRINLAFYYTGQVLTALSASFFF